METISYGKKWFLYKRCFTEQWKESQAAEAHAKRVPYAVAIRKDNGNITVVDARGDYFGVDFLDVFGRDFICYQFQEIEAGRLFLTMATHREFEDNTDRVKLGTSYIFKPNGMVIVETEDFSSSHITKKQIQVDVNGNWELYPNFGDYRSLTRVER
jgi:hypothetical protein